MKKSILLLFSGLLIAGVTVAQEQTQPREVKESQKEVKEVQTVKAETKTVQLQKIERVRELENQEIKKEERTLEKPREMKSEPVKEVERTRRLEE